MHQPIHLEAVEQILSAIYASGDSRLSSFVIRKPGAPHWGGGLSITIFARRKDYIRALLFVRQNGAPYLRSVSISALWSMVTNFLTENFWYILDGEFSRRHDCSYADQIAIKGKIALADALAMSALFRPVHELTLYPLLPIRVAANFESERFFLLNAADLSEAQLPCRISAGNLASAQFPPFADWQAHKRITTSWLAVRSPLPLVSQKMASAILGAVALTAMPRVRYMFSGRAMFGGRCTVTAKNYTVSGGDDPLTPPIANDVVITKTDHKWLKILARLFDSPDMQSHRKLRALEYFYRAWFLDPRERFPALCMSLDSLVGAQSKHTPAAINYAKNMVGAGVDDERLRSLMNLRGAVIHGAAPDVYESEYYEKYYVDYEADPIRDLELVVAKCLRKAIFGSALKCHPDPDAELILNLQVKGKIPATLNEEGIIAEDV